MVALTLYYTSTASTTLVNAGALGTALGGSQSNGTWSTRPSSAVMVELRKAVAANLGSAAFPGTPSGYGQLLEATTLEGQRIPAGTWTCTMNIKYTTTVWTGRLAFQVWKRSSGGVYTFIGQGDEGADTALTTAYVARNASFTTVSPTDFVTGDKLYLEVYFDLSVRPGTSGSIQWYLATTATGVATAQIVTPGYSAPPVTYTRPISGVSASVQAQRPMTGVSASVSIPGLIATSTNALATAYSPNQLTAVAANGDMFATWYDGTNVEWGYAASPYGTWTSAHLLTAVAQRWQAGLYKLANDNVLLVAANSAGNIVSYLFTYTSGTHSWSAGSPVTVLAAGSQYNGGSVAMDIDAQGRIWAAWANNSHVVQVYYTANNGTSWNASTTFTQVSGGLDNNIGLASCGNYLVCVFCASTALFQYARIDASVVSLGAWSTPAAITNSTLDNTTVSVSFHGAGGYGIFAGSGGTLPVQRYDAGANTWSAITNIGASNDKNATLVGDGTNLYCVWCDYSAANNFSLVYKKWVTATNIWDVATTELVASGGNISWPSGGYGNGSLAVIYTLGTATPWSVKWDVTSLAAPPVTYTRPITGVSAAVQAVDVERPITGVSTALQALGLTRPIINVSAATGVTLVTSTRTITGLSSALQATGVARTVIGVSAATKALGLTRPVVSISGSLVFTGTRPIIGVSSALLSSQIARPLSGVSTSPLLFTGSRPISGVSGVTQALGVERPISGVLVSVGMPSAYQTDTLSYTPIRYYRLRESSGLVAIDLGSQGQNGTISATGITYGQPGLLTGENTTTSLLLDGASGNMTFPQTGLPTGAYPWTIELWFNQAVSGGVGASPSLFIMGSYTAQDQAVWLRVTDDQNIAADYNADADFDGANCIPLQTRYHLVATYDGTQTNIYINAVRKSGANWTLALVQNTPAQLGIGPWGTYFNGTISELAIYDYALTSTQVAAKYAVGRTGIRSITGVSASLAPTGVTTYTRTLAGLSSALQALDLARNVIGVTSAIQAIGLSRPLVGVSSATKALNIAHILSGVSAAVRQSGITRPIIGVGAALQALGIPRPIAGVSAATLMPGIARPLIGVSTAIVFTGLRPIANISTSPLLFTGSRSLVSVSAATQALDVKRPIVGMSVAVGVGGVTRTITGVSVAIKALGVTRPIIGVSGATIQIGITRPLITISASVALTRTRTITGVSTALKALGVERPLSGVSATTKALGVTRPLIGITGAIGQGGITRTIISVSTAVQAIGIPRNATPVSSALQAIGVSRPIVGVSATTQQLGLVREISGISVALVQTVSRTLTPISGAVQATVSRSITGISSAVSLRSTRPLTSVSSAVKAFEVARPVTDIHAAVGVAGITKTITRISASVFFEGMLYTYITVVGARGNITTEGTRGTITVEGTRGTITVQEN